MVLETNISRVLFGRLKEGDDLLKSLIEIVNKYQVKSGAVYLIGSLKKVKIGYYDREKGEYVSKEASGFFELVSCMGNISWRENDPVVHIHMAVANKESLLLLGHVLEGNIVDATVEYVIYEFKEKVVRKFDEPTKLYLLDV